MAEAVKLSALGIHHVGAMVAFQFNEMVIAGELVDFKAHQTGWASHSGMTEEGDQGSGPTIRVELVVTARAGEPPNRSYMHASVTITNPEFQIMVERRGRAESD